jgi:hypothetical protein
MDMNGVIAAGLFKPVKEANVIAAIVVKVTCVMVSRNHLKVFFIWNNMVFPPLNMIFSIIYTSCPEPSLRRRSYIINP